MSGYQLWGLGKPHTNSDTIETDLDKLCLGRIQSGRTISAAISSGGIAVHPNADLLPWLWGVLPLWGECKAWIWCTSPDQNFQAQDL